MEGLLKEMAEKIGVQYAGIIPQDENIYKHNLAGKPLLDLPPESPAILAVKEILRRIDLRD